MVASANCAFPHQSRLRRDSFPQGKPLARSFAECHPDKFRSEIAYGGEILLRRMKCFAAQNVKYFICDEMLWTGFARTHYKLPAASPESRRKADFICEADFTWRNHISPCEARFHCRAQPDKFRFRRGRCPHRPAVSVRCLFRRTACVFRCRSPRTALRSAR